MAKGTETRDRDILEMALHGFEQEIVRVQEKIRLVRARLGGRRVNATDGTAPRRRNLSEAARKRISTAQKRRWAEHRRRAAQAAKKAASANPAPGS